MRLPSKVTSYRESILRNFPVVLATLSENEISPLELYLKIKKHFLTVEDYIDTLDCLYALNKIVLDDKTGRLQYVA